MAEGIMRAQISTSGLDSDWQVESAGTWAVNGQPAMGPAIPVMRETGVDLSVHRS